MHYVNKCISMPRSRRKKAKDELLVYIYIHFIVYNEYKKTKAQVNTEKFFYSVKLICYREFNPKIRTITD